MIDWVTAIIPCHHDKKIYGGSVASVDLDGVIEWRVEQLLHYHKFKNWRSACSF